MSVINQMLKDLDKRQGEQVAGSNVVMPVAAKNSNIKLVAIMIIAIILLNIAGIFAWQLYSENQTLKTQIQQPVASEKQVNIDVEHSTVSTEKAPMVATEVENKSAARELVTTLASTVEVTPSTVKGESQKLVNKAQIAADNSTTKQTISDDSEQESHVVTKHLATASEQSTAAVNRVEKPLVKAKPSNIKTADVTASHKPSLTISRSQLSPQALAENKITQAEQAMEINDLNKAESLFEEVLLLIPEHQTARKQLAALWYGKKAYQDAINLLSQGIALAPRAEEMRLMSARIYFEQGAAMQALNVLKPVNDSQQVELQALLASIAAEANEHDTAIDAYRKLLLLEPNAGRWWLGLAVSLDSQSQFSAASSAYSQAIAAGNLSNNAIKFARQRVSELGE